MRNVPVPLAARPAYAALFAGAVSTMPAAHRDLLGLPRLPAAVTRPAVSAVLGGLSLALGPASPSQRAAHERVADLDARSSTP